MSEQEAPKAQGNAATMITVAIPAYNREELIRGAIESALAQKTDQVEVLVIDNCSEDKTVEVARSYPGVKVVVNDRNLGLFGNFNRCLELASGKYVCILCSDDRLREGFLAEALSEMEANPDCGLLTTHAQFIDLEGKPLRQMADHLQPGIYSGEDAIFNFVWFHAQTAFTIFNVPSGMLIRRSLLEGMKLFPTDMKIVGDAEFFCRVLEKSNLVSLSRVGCDETFHPGQEVFKIYDDPARVHEHYAILERYRAILGVSYGRALASEGAVNIALGLKFWKLGHKKTAREHFSIVRSKGVGPLAQFAALWRLLYARLTFKWFGWRSIPRGPIRPLSGGR